MTNGKVWRELDGLLILDKASGATSNKCLQQVRHLLGAAKAGHTGSLDPLASGVLPLCFGEATKVSQFLLDSDKVYRATLRLGVTTTTADSEGAVLQTCEVPAFTREQIEQALQRFRGRIVQTAPAYSALKQNGVPLYKLARRGAHIEPKVREVDIRGLELLDWRHPELELEVHCSKGTYIRTLAEDIGKALGAGAHLTALRRTRAGPFTLTDSIAFDRMQALAAAGALEARLIAMDRAIGHLPMLQLDQKQTTLLRQGQGVSLEPGAELPDVRVYCGEEFIGIGGLGADGRLTAKRLLKYSA